MTSFREKDILDSLTEERARPPEDLADRLKAQIPEEILTGGQSTSDRGRSWYSTPRLAAAAMLILAGGIFLVSRSVLESPTELRNLVAKSGVEFETAPQSLEDSSTLDRLTGRGRELRTEFVDGRVADSDDLGVERAQVSGERFERAAKEQESLQRPARQQLDPTTQSPARRSDLQRLGRQKKDGPREERYRLAAADPSQDEALRRGAVDRRLSPAMEPATVVTAEAPPVDKFNVGSAVWDAERNELRVEKKDRYFEVRNAGLEAHEAKVQELVKAKRELEQKMQALPSAIAEARAPAEFSMARAESRLRAVSDTPAALRIAATDRVEPVPPPRPVPPSTGGTREPNGQAFGDTFFESAGVNPFIDTEDDNLSTFGLDVDTASYTVARGYIESGYLPPADAIRVEEFLNYFDYGDQPPSSADFAIHSEGSESPFGQGADYRLLRFGIVAREIAPADRRPAVLTFLVDVSGSMGREGRIESVKHALRTLLGQLGPADRVGLVTYSDSARILLEPTGDLSSIHVAIRRLQAGGSTNLENGLRLAYQVAMRHHRGDSINRIILCSDGVANVGDTSAEEILASVRDGLDRGIEISTIGFGLGNYNDVLMERLANRGNGNYYYVDGREAAARIFVENLTGTLETIAGDAKVQVTFNPETVSRYRLLGYENRDVADHRFRDDTVDAGEIGAGHRVTALYEIKLRPNVARRARLATLRLRYRSVRAGRIVEIEDTVRASTVAGRWQSSSSGMQLATIVAEFAEVLRSSYWARGSSLGTLQAKARELDLESALRTDTRVSELFGLIGSAALIEREGPWQDSSGRPDSPPKR